MKTNKTLIKELRQELRYWQERTRIDIRSLAGSRAKCQAIAAEMRALQNNPRQHTSGSEKG